MKSTSDGLDAVSAELSSKLAAAARGLAWNPSLPGAKIEGTILRTADGLEVLTVDPAWPTVEVAGLLRPELRVLV